jgi:hypothetical protein
VWVLISHIPQNCCQVWGTSPLPFFQIKKLRLRTLAVLEVSRLVRGKGGVKFPQHLVWEALASECHMRTERGAGTQAE